MNRVRTGELPWTRLDDLHRMILDKILVEFKITGLSAARDRCAQSRVASAAAVAGRGRRADAVEEEVHHRAVVERQHRPDDGDGANIPDCRGTASSAPNWSATTSRDREVYLSAADFLDLEPAEVMMVAAHLGDLRAAKALGLKTAFVARPLEYGPNGKPDLTADAVDRRSVRERLQRSRHPDGCLNLLLPESPSGTLTSGGSVFAASSMCGTWPRPRNQVQLAVPFGIVSTRPSFDPGRPSLIPAARLPRRRTPASAPFIRMVRHRDDGGRQDRHRCEDGHRLNKAADPKLGGSACIRAAVSRSNDAQRRRWTAKTIRMRLELFPREPARLARLRWIQEYPFDR